MNDKRKTIIILVVCIISLLLIMGGSFSAWYYNHVGDNDKIQVHDVELEFLESDSNVISIDDAFPMIDEKGKKQEDTFDFEVKSKTKKTMPIAYNLVLEKVGMKCSEIDKITQDEYPSCFDYTISEEDEIAVITWMKSSDSGLTEEQTEEYYHSFVSHDNNRIYSFFYNMFFEYGATEEQAEQVAEMAVFEAEKKGYEKMLIDSYQEQTGNVINAYTFNAEGITYDHYLSDNQVKIYIEDYEGNIVLQPTFVSELAKSDYILYTKTNIHNNDNEKINDKYKLRVWIDQTVDSSVWNENTNLNYKFRIGVNTEYPKYQVRYNANGGSVSLYSTTGEHPWTETDDGWQSGNRFQNNSTSTITFNLFEITEPAEISFDIGILAESKDYVTYTIYKNGVALEDENSKIIGSEEIVRPKSNIIDKKNVLPSNLTELYDKGKFIETIAAPKPEVITIKKILDPGLYTIEFSYVKDESDYGGKDIAFITNLSFLSLIKNMPNSHHVIGEGKKLYNNIYKKEHYNFVGWSTEPNGQVIYGDNQEVIDLTTKVGDIVDLYAVWEIEKFDVSVIIQNGTIIGDSIKQIEYQGTAMFKLIPNNENLIGIVNCDNGKKGIYGNNVLTIENITSNTTCTVKFEENATTLFEDGTLIINEMGSERNANIEKYDLVKNVYEAMSDKQSYIFNESDVQLWENEHSYIKKVIIGQKIAPVSTSRWFDGCYLLEYGDFTNLNTSDVTDMSYMFSGTGFVTSFNIKGISEFDVSKVTDMRSMFESAGINAKVWNIGDLSSWDTSNVANMNSMFYRAGRDAANWIVNLSNWDVSKVTDMSNMFYLAGYNAAEWSVGDLSEWNVSNVTDMSYMFCNSADVATEFNIGNLSNWNISNVTNVSALFLGSGRNATIWYIGDISSWDTSKVTDMSDMFQSAGYSTKNWDIGELSNWDVSNVTNMEEMFSGAGSGSTMWNIGELSNWNVSNVTDMSGMFADAGESSATWGIGDLSSWDTSKVTDMSWMFADIGRSAGILYNNIGILNIPSGCNVFRMVHKSNYFNASFRINGKLSNYTTMFYSTATGENARINLYYTNSEAEAIVDELITLYGPSGTSSQGNIYKMESES